MVIHRVDAADVADEDVVAAFAHCERIAARRAELDPLASALDEPELRTAAPLYAFARIARALSLESGTPASRCAALQAWEDGLVDAFHGRAEHPVLVALATTVRRFDIPIAPLRELIASCRVDAIGGRFASGPALIAHCRASAGSSARLVLHLTGDADPKLLAGADDLAVGARLADRIADLERDAQAGCRWIPRTELEVFGLSDESQTGTEAHAELVAFQVARARIWLARGRPVLRQASPRSQPLLHGAWVHAQARLEGLARPVRLPSDDGLGDHGGDATRTCPRSGRGPDDLGCSGGMP